jgi:hypothetical protein
MNIKEMMQLLDIKDVSTARQKKNGTVEWELPIKTEWSKSKIRVASFASGYVRCQLSDAYCSYQLNKRYYEDEYFKDYDWDENAVRQVWNGKYRKFKTKKCILIPNEQDRLEYLISYCLKNYYIKNANQVADGKYIPKWKYDNKCNECDRNDGALQNLSVIVNNEKYRII